MNIEPIGTIHTPYKTLPECPRQGRHSDLICEVEVFSKFELGLTDIEGFSHLLILCWFHNHTKSKISREDYSMMVQTPWDIESHGLFTTRSPRRPNPIGVSVVKLLARVDNRLKVTGVDVLDGTPLIDIKPYVPAFDGVEDVKIGWLDGKIKS
ncbi:tRNA (N6-threonylcarbamoyladenosine(37)-N6)-methyltransferase TrmO [Methanosarcinales archaeon ex4484_138]|nr:MAG: tRNA (N6-threonylcarbamoyladenosine(37)-N6)-methyltransferase TrmO [Methanosarcinales archaeon ex4484_138]